MVDITRILNPSERARSRHDAQMGPRMRIWTTRAQTALSAT